MESKNKTNIYLMILIVLNIFLVFIASVLFFDFKNNRLAELDRLNTELASLRELEAKTRSINQTVNESKEERDRLNLYFITKDTIQNFIRELESIAERLGVIFNLENIEVKKDAKQSTKGSYLRLSLTAEGSFVNVFHFLRVMESLPYQIRFNTISISRIESEDVNDVRGRSFWQNKMTVDLMSYVDR